MDIAIRVVVGTAVALALIWAILVVALIVVRPKGGLLSETLRVLPDAIRLLRRLATDKSVAVAVRVRLWLLFVYLAMPIDVIPDFIPVLGYADDAIIVAAVLRSVVRRAGPEAIRRNWPGTTDGLATVWRLCRLEGTAS
jgi:uncharacterized membrane protein YkvA (DUF1232 family)